MIFRAARPALPALAGAFALCCAPVAAAGDAPSLALELSTPQTGWVAAHVTGPAGATVTVSEQGKPIATVTLSPAGAADVPRAVAWRCDRRDRTLSAQLAAPDASAGASTADIRTPSCRDRLALVLRPAHPRAGRRMTIEVRDRWRLGDVPAELCTAQPGGVRRRCRTVSLAAGVVRAAVNLKPSRPGRWSVTLRGPGGAKAGRDLLVAPASRRLRVLATGDSMIQIIDGDLQRSLGALGPITVHSDAHISTGITKPFMLDWVGHARASARSIHPDVTVMFLGANDGYPMGTPAGPKAACCDEAWVHEYARRARMMMRAYARGGAGTVYWMLLPTPRGKQFQTVFGPVNRALREAAAAFPGVVHLVDLGATFTPGGHFRQTMRWHGRRVSVRQADGVHLSVAGAAIATELVVQAMRHDGLVH